MSRLAPQSGRSTLVCIAWQAGQDPGGFSEFIDAYMRDRFSAGLAERVTLASSELLDNAIRYGSLSREIVYSLDMDDRHIIVSVTNATVRPRLEMLSEQVRRLQTSPERVYLEEFERSVQRSGRRSMLGLARICHEAEMHLELNIQDALVTVTAHHRR
jgi:hypothetical protein